MTHDKDRIIVELKTEKPLSKSKHIKIKRKKCQATDVHLPKNTLQKGNEAPKTLKIMITQKQWEKIKPKHGEKSYTLHGLIYYTQQKYKRNTLVFVPIFKRWT